MTQRTYYDDGTPEWQWWQRGEPAGRAGVALLHGITLADLDTAARLALSRNVGLGLFDRTERYEIAWSAAATALYEAAATPTISDLATAGWYAIAEARTTEMRHHGIDHARHIGEGRPRFAAYWTPPAVTPPEERIVERLALAQVWGRLTPGQQEALAALAAHGTAGAAADALGKGRPTTWKRIREGRARIAALWVEGETPRPIVRDRRAGSYAAGLSEACGRGHVWSEETTRWARSSRGGRTYRVCRQCRRDRDAEAAA